jgi:ATP-binding cassette subfamily B multidrug efflux pump
MSEPAFTSRLRPLRETLTLPILAGSLLFAIAATTLALWLPRMLGSIVDELVAGDLPIGVLVKEVGLYFGLALVAALFSKWMRQVPMRWAPRISHHLRVRLHRHLLSLDENQIHDQRVGELMSRLQSDVNAVAEMLAHGGHSLVRASLTLGIAFTFMFQRSTSLALVLSLLLPFLVVIGFVMMRSIRFRHLGVQEQLGVLTTYCQESFGGLRLLRGLGLESLRLERFRDLNQEFIHRNLALSRIEIIAWPVIHIGFVIGNVLLLWVGGRQVIQGEIQLGMLVEFQQYLMILQWPSLSVAWTLSLKLRGRASLGRLQEIMDAVPQVVDDAEVENELPEGIGEIRLEHVSLELEGQRVLHDISCTVQPGEMLGITGPTGSGKTLLLQLLLRRQYPETGRILIYGRVIRELSLE